MPHYDMSISVISVLYIEYDSGEQTRMAQAIAADSNRICVANRLQKKQTKISLYNLISALYDKFLLAVGGFGLTHV